MMMFFAGVFATLWAMWGIRLIIKHIAAPYIKDGQPDFHALGRETMERIIKSGDTEGIDKLYNRLMSSDLYKGTKEGLKERYEEFKKEGK